MVFASRHISISIERSPEDVYAFVVNPENLPQWAAGLSAGIRKVGEDWVADSPMGEVKVRFAERNSFGILDHLVTLPSGEEVLNPMRVLPNGTGCEVVFTLFKREGMSDEDFEKDAALITLDLQTLRDTLSA